MSLEKVIISKKTLLTQHVLECVLDCDENLTIQPGQYILLKLDGEWRSFSVAGMPTSNSFKLVIQLVNGTKTSKFFNEAKIGDTVEMQEPQGNVVVPKNHDTVFVATGTGIIPLVVIAKHALEVGYKHDMRIIFGVREQGDLFYLKELQDLAEKYENCSIVIAMSKSHPEWHGFKGRISEYLEKYIDDMRKSEFYVCGRKETVASIMKLLEDNGVRDKRRHLIE